ncbi:MAG TPA: hypothetical protein VFR97_14840 [Capillimicrobium sp.]|nr:hypothetical protein [Capillimicrobium sp.]
MEDAFVYVVVAVTALATIVGVVTLAGAGRSYDQIGRGGLSLDEPPKGPPAGASAGAVRDDEIRQMLEARNARRARRGEAPLDVERELARLTAPAVDPALEAEIRDLVVARNARRARKGQPPLDVETEVRRQLDALR